MLEYFTFLMQFVLYFIFLFCLFNSVVHQNNKYSLYMSKLHFQVTLYTFNLHEFKISSPVLIDNLGNFEMLVNYFLFFKLQNEFSLEVRGHYGIYVQKRGNEILPRLPSKNEAEHHLIKTTYSYESLTERHLLIETYHFKGSQKFLPLLLFQKRYFKRK